LGTAAYVDAGGDARPAELGGGHRPPYMVKGLRPVILVAAASMEAGGTPAPPIVVRKIPRPSLFMIFPGSADQQSGGRVMNVKIISRKLNPKTVALKLVDGSVVKGKINLHHDEAVIQRVSDVFTRIDDPFLVVFDATAEGKAGKVLIINKHNIIWASPEED
jgi:hypothetical protein